jgi:hypothetical protein
VDVNLQSVYGVVAPSNNAGSALSRDRINFLQIFRDKCGCPFAKYRQDHTVQLYKGITPYIKPLEYYSQLPEKLWASELITDVLVALPQEVHPIFVPDEMVKHFPAQFDQGLAKCLIEFADAQNEMALGQLDQFWPVIDLQNNYGYTLLENALKSLHKNIVENNFSPDEDNCQFNFIVSSPLKIDELDAFLRKFTIPKIRGFTLHIKQEATVIECLPLGFFENCNDLEHLRICVSEGKMLSEYALKQIEEFISGRIAKDQKPLKSIHLVCDNAMDYTVPFLSKVNALKSPPDIVFESGKHYAKKKEPEVVGGCSPS